MEVNLLSKLAEYGLLALLLALSVYANWKQKGENKDLWEGRLGDFKALKEVLELQAETNRAVAQTQEERGRLLEAMGRATEMAAQRLESLTIETKRYREFADNAHRELQRLSTLMDKGR